MGIDHIGFGILYPEFLQFFKRNLNGTKVFLIFCVLLEFPDIGKYREENVPALMFQIGESALF